MHRYDPVDLQQSFAAAQDAAAEHQQVMADADDTTLTAKEKELANSGLMNLVQVTANNNDDDNYSSSRQATLCSSTSTVTATEVIQSTPSIAAENNSNISVHDHHDGSKQIMSELDRWETARQENEGATFFSEGEDDDDSDDDLL